MTATFRPSRRTMLTLAGAAMCASAGRSAFAQAQTAGWRPTKNVRLVVPFAAGGANDIIARVIAERLSAMWGQQVYIENKPGAGANIGTADVARADADGHHLLITSSAIAVNRFLFEKLPFDPVADFAPVSLVAIIPNVMVVPAASTARSVADFIAEAKAKPGTLNYGSAGIGTSLHLIGELFKRSAGVDIKHVPYRGAAPAMNDLIAGRIEVMFDTATVSMNQIRGGTIRALGVSTQGAHPRAARRAADRGHGARLRRRLLVRALLSVKDPAQYRRQRFGGRAHRSAAGCREDVAGRSRRPHRRVDAGRA